MCKPGDPIIQAKRIKPDVVMTGKIQSVFAAIWVSVWK
jgi:hypothetical protein